MRVMMLGATGTAGRAITAALLAAGHDVACAVRPGSAPLPEGTRAVEADVGLPGGAAAAFGRDRYDAVVSALASRTGAPADAWAIDHRAHSEALAAAGAAGAGIFVLVSAICVQRPRLAFQHAKLAFEAELMASDLAWSVVRPTALMKSLSGQVARVAAGRPFLVFGTGRLTACKPIADADLGAYVAGCLTDPARQRRILPIGGPGPALTPREMGETLFALLGRRPRFRSVPPGLLGAAARACDLGAALRPALAAKAEMARIGHYYATESMLVWDGAAGRYDAQATPETGRITLRAHYRDLLAGRTHAALGAHALFDRRAKR